MSSPSPGATDRRTLYATASEDGGVLLDIRHDRILKLNLVGAEIWKLLSAGETESQVVLTIAGKYGVDQQRVAQDTVALLRRSTELGISPADSIVTDQGSVGIQQSGQQSFPWYGQDASAPRPTTSLLTVFFALAGLAAFDFILSVFSFKSLLFCVGAWPTRRASRAGATGRICSAVEKAAVWYPKTALCLQRSAVTTCLLRSQGIPARMTVGVRPMPFLAHAWVEVDGSVVNDWPRVRSFYQSLVSY
jgi:hypothetical protein